MRNVYDQPNADYRWEGENRVGVYVDLSPGVNYDDLSVRYNDRDTAVEIQNGAEAYRVPLTGLEEFRIEADGGKLNNGVLSVYLDILEDMD